MKRLPLRASQIQEQTFPYAQSVYEQQHCFSLKYGCVLYTLRAVQVQSSLSVMWQTEHSSSIKIGQATQA